MLDPDGGACRVDLGWGPLDLAGGPAGAWWAWGTFQGPQELGGVGAGCWLLAAGRWLLLAWLVPTAC